MLSLLHTKVKDGEVKQRNSLLNNEYQYYCRQILQKFARHIICHSNGWEGCILVRNSVLSRPAVFYWPASSINNSSFPWNKKYYHIGNKHTDHDMHFVSSKFNQELLTILQNHINESTVMIYLESETPIKAFTLVLICNYYSQCDSKCTNKHLL